MTLPADIAAKLDPVFAAWLDASNPSLPEGYEPTVAQMREDFARLTQASSPSCAESVTSEDLQFSSRGEHEIPVRVYRQLSSDTLSACCVYVHGGGWVLGDLDTHDGICRDLCAQSGQTILAIDYRLSPEYHFPAAIEDVVDVLMHLQRQAAALKLDASHISLCGDSAGAGLAIAASLLLRGTDALPSRLALIYPAVGADTDRPSFIENQHVPGLSAELMRYFFISYIGGETLPDPLAAPLLVDDLQSLPPVFISGAQFDPLRDDATDLAARLQDAGVDTHLRIEASLGHSYLWVRQQSPAARTAFTALLEFLSQDTR